LIWKCYDTLVLARRNIPADTTRSTTYVRRYGVDRSRRTQCGALLDGELLAAVCVELTTTRQAALQLDRSHWRRRTFRQSSERGHVLCLRL